MFNEEELKNIAGLKRKSGYIEVKCGCTSKRYGDTIGKLKILANGQFIIDCECRADCSQKNLTPCDFEKHSGRQGVRKWKNHIWVYINEEKVSLSKTPLLKYFKFATNEASSSSFGKQIFHRDEFVRCSKCNKERRFRLRTKEECRIYHDALAVKRWKCAHRPYDKITCHDMEERASRKSCRGCPRHSKCKGCTACVCFGCVKCRFADCNCRICVDFMQNAEP